MGELSSAEEITMSEVDDLPAGQASASLAAPASTPAPRSMLSMPAPVGQPATAPASPASAPVPEQSSAPSAKHPPLPTDSTASSTVSSTLSTSTLSTSTLSTSTLSTCANASIETDASSISTSPTTLAPRTLTLAHLRALAPHIDHFPGVTFRPLPAGGRRTVISRVVCVPTNISSVPSRRGSKETSACLVRASSAGAGLPAMNKPAFADPFDDDGTSKGLEEKEEYLFDTHFAARLIAHLAAPPTSPLSPRSSPPWASLALDESSLTQVPSLPALQSAPFPCTQAISIPPQQSPTPRRLSSTSACSPVRPSRTPASRTPLSPTLPEAWWGGSRSVRSAAWAAVGDAPALPVERGEVEWIPSGVRVAGGEFEFVPRFDDEEMRVLRGLLGHSAETTETTETTETQQDNEGVEEMPPLALGEPLQPKDLDPPSTIPVTLDIPAELPLELIRESDKIDKDDDEPRPRSRRNTLTLSSLGLFGLSARRGRK